MIIIQNLSMEEQKMIEVKVVDNEFFIRGSFDLGYAGKYINKDFSNKGIEILDTYEEVVEDYTENYGSWHILKSYLEDKELNEENVAKAISEYYNGVEVRAQKSIKQINDNLLINVFDDMVGCSNKFWEIPNACIKEKMPNCQEEAYNEVIYQPHWKEIDALSKEYYRTPNNNSLKKSDVEKRLREIFPMFDMDAFLKGIRPEILCLQGETFSFQCSDSWGKDIMCAAYDELDVEFTFTDWHNF